MHECISILAQKGIFTFITWLKIKHNFQRKLKGIYCFLIKQNIFKRWLLKISVILKAENVLFINFQYALVICHPGWNFRDGTTFTTEYQAILCCNASFFKSVFWNLPCNSFDVEGKQCWCWVIPKITKMITVLCFQWAHLYNLQLFFYKGTK